MKQIRVTKIDDDNFLVELDNIIAQPFRQSDAKEMYAFIIANIKKLQVPEEMRMFNTLDVASRILKTKASKELELKNKKKNPQTKLI